MDKKLVVIIPIHKPDISKDEEISLLQCKKILDKYDAYLVYPSQLNINNYLELYPSLIPQPVPDPWLSSLMGYNTMKRLLSFYTLFQGYDYMLTYELDAYIFSTDWEKANCFKYDYIGAPWFDGYSENKKTIMGVGNSGFSIRRIKSCLTVLRKTERIRKAWSMFTKLKLHKLMKFGLLLHLFDKDWKTKSNNYYFFPLTREEHINEDIFWGSIVPQVFEFKVADIQDSIRFSFETQPSVLFSLNNCQLPIGCHAWTKYDKNFWKSFIK